MTGVKKVKRGCFVRLFDHSDRAQIVCAQTVDIWTSLGGPNRRSNYRALYFFASSYIVVKRLVRKRRSPRPSSGALDVARSSAKQGQI